MPKQYFFEAGTFYDLSYAEFISVIEAFGFDKGITHRFSDKIFLAKHQDLTEELSKRIFNRLGGFVKFGEVIEDVETFLDIYTQKKEKVTFGISIIGEWNTQDSQFLKKLGNEIKRGLKEYHIPSRFVSPMRDSKSLNSAQLKKNQILEKGFELCILRNEQQEEKYGKTIEVQNVEEFVTRDYDKPYTDTKMGTLPPKLARMMVNLTGLKNGTLWDPFCGSGTILMEGLVLGFDVIGSDIDENALYYSEENIKWLHDRGSVGEIRYRLLSFDVNNPYWKITRDLKKTEISGVVCEPFMGPPQKRVMEERKSERLLNEVKELYTSLFKTIDEIAKPNFTIVMIVPSYKTFNGWKTFGIRDIASKRWDIMNTHYSGGRDLKWSRKNSIITRNIFILRKR